MKWISVNGKIQDATEPVLLADDRGYRYGDGLFETMKMINGAVPLLDLHFDRLFQGLKLLQFELPGLFTRDKLAGDIAAICKKNACDASARVRLSISRGNGGLYDADRKLNYLIECWPLNESFNHLNENGLVIGVYDGARKNCDTFSNLKSANFLPYSMAAIYAKDNQLNDCLVLNTHDQICDSTIANLFWIKDDILFTPPLTEGCVDGVMRKYLLNELAKNGMKVQQEPVSPTDLEPADEIFLTNAITGLRWVKNFRDHSFVNKRSSEIYQQIIKTIFR